MSIDPIVRRLQETPQRKRLWYGVAVVGVVAVVIFALNAVYGFVGGASSTTGSERTVTVARGTVQSAVTASGNVSVARSAAANFSTSGTVTSVKVEVGDVVTAGQQLATLDSAAAEADLETAKANLAQAEATLASAKGGASAEQQASNASSLHQAQAQVTTAKQQLEADQKALATAQQQLADSKKLDCPPTSSSSAASSSSSPSSSASSQSNASSRRPLRQRLGRRARAARVLRAPLAYRVVDRARLRERRKRIGWLRAAAPRPRRRRRRDESDPGHDQDERTCRRLRGGRRPDGDHRPGSGGHHDHGRGRGGEHDRDDGQASAVTSTGAALNGTVTPAGLDTNYHFRYGSSPTDLGSSTPSKAAGSGSTAVPVTAAITGLTPGRSYWFRVVATNSSGTTNGALSLFTTAEATLATTGVASPVASTSATLKGR